jgi:RimJ/RimL family protein N-acetyltransferase
LKIAAMNCEFRRATEMETERLILRPLELSDAEQIQELFPHWEIVRHLNNVVPWPYPADGARRFVRDVALPAIQQGRSWVWTLRLKTATEQLIGMIELRIGETNRAFWLGLPWQGRGLMSEATVPVNDFWFEELGFSVMRVPKAIANITSRRISEKNGMRVIAREERHYVGGRLPTEIWELTAEDWRRVRKAKRI